MLDDAAELLLRARQEARHVDEGDDRDIEGIAEAHEPRGLARGIDVEAARQHHRLVGDEAHGAAGHAAETDHDVSRPLRRQLEEVTLVHDLQDQFLDVVGLVGILRHQRIERGIVAVRRVERRAHRSLLAVVGRQEIDEAAQL